MSAMISVEEALNRVLASAETPLEEEQVALQEAYGRVLAHDLKALRTQPPFPNSAMDGYAIRSADTASAPATLMVVGESAAGRAFEGVVGAGQAVRIFTGCADAGRRRHHRHSGRREPRGRPYPSVSDRAAGGQPASCGHGLSCRRHPHPRWPPTGSPGRGAGGGGEPHRPKRPSTRTGRDSGDRRRTGRAGRRTGAGADRRLQQFRRRRVGRRLRWRRHRSRHRNR